ncbi:hypothetical protein B0H67DRAFT_641531 [Lasiosphaeris hirsuta]|uniref:C2H2-type domain-containing protein n=1 Tax=Lasiosphaeris hirsuta TaxID=260670 RepID=A0AA40E7A3_9PEZI|nr:hypothetical protein B0H67DRAFT_641531 [Lasiosphaeris hirsuta]
MPIRRVTTSLRKKLANPQDSCGREILTTRIGRKRAWWACGPAMKQFESEIEDDLDSALRNTALGYADIYIRLYMIGSRPETAGPIIMVCCSNSVVKDGAESSIRRSGILQKYPEFRLGASALPLEQPQPARALGADVEMEDLPDAGHVLATSSQPEVGRRLFTMPEDGHRLRSATAGPMLQIGDKCYQLTVSHIFEAEESSPHDVDYEECRFDSQSDDEDDIESDPDYAATSRGSLSPKSPPRSWAELDDTSTEASGSSSQMSALPSPRSPQSQAAPESPRVAPGSPRPAHQQATTPPSRDGLVSAGKATVSSKGGSNPGLDYALIPTDTPEGANEVQLHTETGITTLRVKHIASIGNEEKNIIAITSSGGVIRGVLIPGATYFGGANASSLQKIYAIELEGVVVEGDCGAAVIDEKTGDFYGHIVRGCSGTQIAYIVAASDVFEDLCTRFGQDVMLASLKNRQREMGAQQGAHRLNSHDTAAAKVEAREEGLSSASTESLTPFRLFPYTESYYSSSFLGGQGVYENWEFKHPNFESLMDTALSYDNNASHEFCAPDQFNQLDSWRPWLHPDFENPYHNSYLETGTVLECMGPSTVPHGGTPSPLRHSPYQPYDTFFGPPRCGDIVAPDHGEDLETNGPMSVDVDSGYCGSASMEWDMEKGRCPHPDCGKSFKDLKAHMLTHQTERPEKCPIQTCEYHVKGFARKYDANRHTLTHYKGTMVCGFCPGSGSRMEKSFNRADVFKRHLTSVHGVEQRPPNSRKRAVGGAAVKARYAPDTTASKCSTCSRTFGNAQEFYEHLDDCVLRIVRMEDPAEAINAQRLTEIAGDKEVLETPAKHRLSDDDIADTGTADDDDDDDELKYAECNHLECDYCNEPSHKGKRVGQHECRMHQERRRSSRKYDFTKIRKTREISKAKTRRRHDCPKSPLMEEAQSPLFMDLKVQVQAGDGHSLETYLGTHEPVEGKDGAAGLHC